MKPSNCLSEEDYLEFQAFIAKDERIREQKDQETEQMFKDIDQQLLEYNQQLEISRRMFTGVMNKEFERLGITNLSNSNQNTIKIADIKTMTLQEMMDIKRDFEQK